MNVQLEVNSVETTSPEMVVVTDADAQWTVTRSAQAPKAAAKPSRLSHEEMLAMASRNGPPPQEWFDEDLTGLRKPK